MMAIAGVLLLLCAQDVAAQRSGSRFQPAGRVDVLSARITAVHAGAELGAIAGRYTRIAAVGGVGGSWDNGSSGISARGEVLGRFVLDPDLTVRWAPYVAGGLGARYDRIVGWRATLTAALGVEGPNWNGVIPFVEIGYGGGGRFGMGLRRARAHGR